MATPTPNPALRAKTFTGARAIVKVDGVAVGIFDSADFSTSIGTEPIFTLGKFGAQEIVATSYEIVTLNCSGFRVIGHGGGVLPKFPSLDQLLTLENFTINVIDRQGAAGSNSILVVENCIPTSYGTGYSAKSTSRIRVTYQGTAAHEEGGISAEGGAVAFPG